MKKNVAFTLISYAVLRWLFISQVPFELPVQGGFQLLDLIIPELKSHVIPYKFKSSHWLKLQYSDWRAYLVKDFFLQIGFPPMQWEHSNSQQVMWYLSSVIIKSINWKPPISPVQIILDPFRTFWTGPKTTFHYWILLFELFLKYLFLSKTIWTCPK